MAEKSNKNIPDKNKNNNGKPKFNSNWIFAILAVSIILFEVLFSGKSSQKATTSMLKDMIINRDIEESTQAVQAILDAERHRRHRQIGLNDFVKSLREGQ